MSVAGSIKRNPENGDVAVRTAFPEGENYQLDAMAWLVATIQIGARHATSAEVADWDDIFTPNG